MTPIIRHLGMQDYVPTWEQMKQFTDQRDQDTPDEIWLLQHPPVFTQGQAGKAEHVLNPGDIPIIQADRGGQVTYHGPGQLVVYFLLDLHRWQIGIRTLVSLIEQAVVTTLADYGIPAKADPKAPGVYIDGSKIASIGLRVRKGRSYHGLAFNLDMDLSPFQRINPCGFQNLTVTQLKNFCDFEWQDVENKFIEFFVASLTEKSEALKKGA